MSNKQSFDEWLETQMATYPKCGLERFYVLEDLLRHLVETNQITLPSSEE